MSRFTVIRLLLACSLLALLAGCTRDPNVRKQKYLASGDKYFADAKYHEAAIQYRNAIQVDGRFAQAHYQLSQTYLKLGDANNAFQELSRTVDLDGTNFKARTDLANLLVTVRNPDGSPDPNSLKQAKEHLDKVRESAPNLPETHEAWANYYAAQGQLDKAIAEMDAAVALDPNRSESYLLRALLKLRANLTDQARVDFEKAAAVGPKDTNAQMALAGFYQSRNQLADAEKQFRHAIDVDPKNPGPRAALVRLLLQEGKKSDAEVFLQQTKKDMPDNSEGYRMLGDYYFASSELDKAVAEYSSLYQDHPKDPQVKKNYIQLLILKNRLDDAEKLNNEVLKANAHDVDALVYKGQIQLHRNDATGAVDSLQSALRNDPNNAVAHYQLGMAYQIQHDVARAESEWREAVRLRPDLTDAQRALAAIEIARGDVDGLLLTAQAIITSQPFSGDGYILKAVADTARQKYSDAEQDAERARERAPQSPAPYVQLGNVQLSQKHHAEAIKFYQEALDKDPSSSEGLSGIMNTYFAQKDYDKAIAAANAQIAKAPNSNFYDLLGTALFNGKKDLHGADAALRKAIELDKNNSDAVEKLGKVEVQEGNADQALALYQQSIKDNPREVRFYILAGELYESKQNYDQAKGMYQQALAIQPDQPLASNNLAYVMLETGGNVDVALNMAQTARRGMPDSANAADTLGWAYYQKGVYQSAISQCQEALRLSEKHGEPDDGDLHYHCGMEYKGANQKAQALQQLEKAVKLSPKNEDAKKALSELRG